jgi:hypothetical protein
MSTFEMSGGPQGAPTKAEKMSNRNYNYMMPWNNQHQGQHQGQAEAQGQGQMQGQGQGQHQSQSSENENGNANGNMNGSLNMNGNANGNLNYNDNNADNDASNSASNTANNNNNTHVNTRVVTDVSVSADVDLSGYEPTDDDFADIDLACSTVNDIFMAKGDVNYDPGNELNIKDILTDALNGAGNDTGTVNAQFNNLVDNDSLENATVGGTLTQTNTSTGGTATSDDGIDAGSEDGEGGMYFPHMDYARGGQGGDHGDDGGGTDPGNWASGNGDDGYVSGQSLSSAASAIDTTAFNQSIVMGANVLGNTVDMSVVGGNMSSTYVGDDSSDSA